MTTDAIAAAGVLPEDCFDPAAGSFVDAIQPDDLVYFVLNVGDGDTQLLLLPEREDGGRRALVVDVATTTKVPALLESLVEKEVIRRDEPEVLPLVIGSHPHSDHLGGMPQLLQAYGDRIGQYWDCGYSHPSGPFVETMVELERQPGIRYLQPTSGTTCFIDSVKVTVLTPGIGLRGRFDTYGVAINDASLTVRIDYPTTRVARGIEDDERFENRSYLKLRQPWSLLLGGDAQHTSWAQATIDFPQLHRHHNADLYRQLRDAVGRDSLRADIFKVPHHASKRGLTLELVERVSPRLTLISSVAGGGRYNFPHPLAVESIREALDPTGLRTGPRERSDWELGIHCTGARNPSSVDPAGSVAVRIPCKRGRRLEVWRFSDAPRATIELDDGRKLTRTY